MTAKEAQEHIEDWKAEISDLLFFLVTVEREIELIKPKIESKIVKPTRTINLSNITQKDLEVDVTPIHLATMEIVQLRKSFHYAKLERANTIAAIEAKKQVLSSYVEHIKQELAKQSSQIKDEIIFELFRKAQSIKDLSPDEKETFEDIRTNILPTLNKGKEARLQLYETLQNLVKQHQ